MGGAREAAELKARQHKKHAVANRLARVQFAVSPPVWRALLDGWQTVPKTVGVRCTRMRGSTPPPSSTTLGVMQWQTSEAKRSVLLVQVQPPGPNISCLHFAGCRRHLPLMSAIS